MALLNIALKSLLNRKFTVLLTVFAVAISVSLLLGVERVRTEAKSSFANTLSGTDLIVGARTGSVQLLLYSVFHIGNASNNISWESYQEIEDNPSVNWSVPLSLGDSHRGFRVLGTEQSYFEHYRYGQKQPLRFAQGAAFEQLFDVVIGAQVAEQLGYQLGEKIVIAHGTGRVSFVEHDQMPFTISGILARTGTPVDQTVMVSLGAIEAIHSGWNGNKADLAHAFSAEQLQPKAITAALLGLNSRIHTFQLQRAINNYPEEPLMAILPGVTLHELWKMMSVAEQALIVISFFVVGAGLLGMLTMILSSLNERRREMAILRAVGAKPRHIFLLMMSESLILALLGALLGVLFLYSGIVLAQPLLLSEYGLQIALSPPTLYEWKLLGLVGICGLVIGSIPALQAYRMSLVDGMNIRV